MAARDWNAMDDSWRSGPNKKEPQFEGEIAAGY